VKRQGRANAESRLVHERLRLQQQHVLPSDIDQRSQPTVLLAPPCSDPSASEELVGDAKTDVVARPFVAGTGIAQSGD
jgi:hypothetical protein